MTTHLHNKEGKRKSDIYLRRYIENAAFEQYEWTRNYFLPSYSYSMCTNSDFFCCWKNVLCVLSLRKPKFLSPKEKSERVMQENLAAVYCSFHFLYEVRVQEAIKRRIFTSEIETCTGMWFTAICSVLRTLLNSLTIWTIQTSLHWPAFTNISEVGPLW